MKRAATIISLIFMAAFGCGMLQADPRVTPGTKSLPLPGEAFRLNGHDAFVILPDEARSGTPWVWYAPTLRGLPSGAETWMFERFLAKGIAIAGIDVGESYGAPAGRAIYDSFYRHLVGTREFGTRPVLLARSRGGLMLYSWAVEHPRSVGAVAGIYPVCNIASYPGLERAAGAYQMTAAELETALAEHNPIDRLAPLAGARIPIHHIHGDSDRVVPLEANSAELAKRYRALGGPVEVEVVPGQGHNMWAGWFESQALTDFVIEHALRPTAPESNPVPKAGATVTMTGRLAGGIMAIGGETTGWRLTYPVRQGKATIEVDMKGIKDAGTYDGRKVTITGTIISKAYVERGTVLILKANTVS